jgi:membrane protein required for colicin V production
MPLEIQLGILDYVYLGLLAIGFLIGIVRGALKEGYSLSAFILSFLVAVVLSLSMTEFLNPYIPFLNQQYLYSFLLVFIFLNILLIWVMSRILKKDKKEKKPAITRLIGGIWGLAKGACYGLWITWVMMLQTWVDLELLYTTDSFLYPKLTELLLVFTRYYT